MKTLLLLSILGLAGVTAGRRRSDSKKDVYKGVHVGKLSTLEHKVSGDVYCVDNTTIYIEDFTYDGEAPDAFFFAGNKENTPSNRGFIIPDERSRTQVLGPYSKRNLILKFPVTKKGQRSFSDIKWISVWCRRFGIDFGHVKVPRDLVKPAPQVATGLHSDKPRLTSESVTIVDTHTIELEDFTFDGTVADAIFVVGSGDRSSSGAQVASERGSTQPLSKYTGRTLRLEIPDEFKGQPMQYFGVWSPTKGMLASVTFDPDVPVPPALSSLP
ncbi:protein Skeletor, isoforms B/C-like [Portunus trituberculatus]|uniref:protein Skeletor, isoforms B/C-like n=1 Tax=Portunus trituberculatus TaxID=210409 RepID=UPI001E1CBDC3|nr:protein Skeletor, isoforms B/C-like [Portunus trituberculatus]